MTTITEAVFARALSARRSQRIEAERLLPRTASPVRKPTPAEIDAIRDGLYASKIVAYAQGFEEMGAASDEFGWELKLSELAMIWRGGCIIRARLLHRIGEAYEANADVPNLVLQDFFRAAIANAEPNWRKVVSLAVENGIPVPAFASALTYYDGMRRARGPANLLQGLRDYFGAHTYRRLDRPGSFHTRWGQDGDEVAVE